MNIAALLAKTARSLPERPAVSLGDEVTTNYGTLHGRAGAIAGALQQIHGLEPGERVAIVMANRTDYLEALFGIWYAGLVAVPVNAKLHPREVAYILGNSGTRLCIADEGHADGIESVRDEVPGLAAPLVAGSDDWRAMLGHDAEGPAAARPDDPAWLFYTSGTTGRPKGATISHRNLMIMTLSYFADLNPITPDDCVLHAAPLSHGAGLYALPFIAKGANNVIPESGGFEPVEVLSLIEQHPGLSMFAAPTMIKRLVDSPALGRYDCSSLKTLNYGGGPMLAEDLLQAMTRFGPCLVQLYGQAESPMTITYLPHRAHLLEGTAEQMKRLSSAGFARTDVEVRIVDKEDNEVAPGEIGEVVTRSDLVMKGYWKNPQATAETLRNGWLHTGDVGYLDERGYLFLMDRSKDMIVSGGENIYPREIEEVVIQHPAVAEVAVIGVPDPQWGEAIKAVVSLAPGCEATEEELIDFCREYIAGYKKPKSVDFVEELPKNNYGKIVKHALRARYWKGKESRVI